MELHSSIFWAVAIIMPTLLIVHTLTQGRLLKSWVFWFCLATAFLLFSGYTVMESGLLGFYAEHAQRGFWGSQIWMDLVFMAACAWYALLPQLRQYMIPTIPTLLLVLATGSVGMAAVIAWLAYKKSKTP